MAEPATASTSPVATRDVSAYDRSPLPDLPQQVFKLHLLDPRRKGMLIMGSLIVTMLATAAAIALSLAYQNPVILSLNVITMAAAAFASYVIIRLGARITELEAWIRRMGAGDLEYSVPPRAHDELTEITMDLEVLRQRSIRAQEFDLVNQLSQEIQDKNDTLENALAELSNTQDQMISKQKLAEIGELAAGIAHEVRNPLNIISNFSATSRSLMEELTETIDDDAMTDAERREAVAEIAADLNANMQRIAENCERASRIIQDVTNMSRSDSGQMRPVELNKLLHDYAILAYQATRAQDRDFNVAIDENMDPNMGEFTCVPEQISRVFINIAQNACYATRKKQQDPDTPADYRPTVTLATRRRRRTVTAIIRDNGSGMPPEVIDKIFTPFFTTKPTDEGTGLGLSLSHEIVRHHGGVIKVMSQPGEFTEMRVQLPVNRPADPAEAINIDDEDDDE